jgi:hypothetical protein
LVKIGGIVTCSMNACLLQTGLDVPFDHRCCSAAQSVAMREMHHIDSRA